MSTILKALKQAEQNSPDLNEENTVSFNVRTTLHSRMVRQQRGNFFRTGKLVIPVLLVLAAFVCTSWFFFSGGDKNPSSFVPLEQPPIMETSPDMDDHDMETVPENAAHTINPPSTANDRAEPEQSSVAKKMDKQELTDESPPSLPAAMPEPDKPSVEDPITDEETQSTAPAPQILPFKDNSLKVQAISWDKEPESRIAVINNRVLGEGESIQGYRLDRIEADAVILYQSGRTYRLGFQYR